MKPRTLSDRELDAVSGGSYLSYNTVNYYSGNGGYSGDAVAANALGHGSQRNVVQTGNANGAAGGAYSIVNSGKIFGFI